MECKEQYSLIEKGIESRSLLLREPILLALLKIYRPITQQLQLNVTKLLIHFKQLKCWHKQITLELIIQWWSKKTYSEL